MAILVVTTPARSHTAVMASLGDFMVLLMAAAV
jgi:hypothetical protein